MYMSIPDLKPTNSLNIKHADKCQIKIMISAQLFDDFKCKCVRSITLLHVW